MKIGYVVKMFPRLSETFILNEILALEARGVDVQIFSLNPPADGRFHAALASLRSEIVYLPRADSSEMWRAVRASFGGLDLRPEAAGSALLNALTRKDGDGLKLLLQGLWLAETAARLGIDHLHAHFATSATAAAMTAHELFGLTFSFTAHAKDIYHQDLDRALLLEAIERASFVVTVTSHNVSTLEQISPRARLKVRKIYNGVPVQSLTPSPEPASDRQRILCVGRLVEKKGFEYLIDACALLRKEGLRFECIIVGAGPLEAELRARVAGLDLSDCVSLTGPLSHDAVVTAIRSSHIMVLPCIIGQDGNRDALPTVLLEAMALGRPVVSTDLPGVTEIVDEGETGLLVPQRDTASLAQAVAALLRERALRSAFGRAGRAKAERVFDLNRNVGELASLFESVVRPQPAVQPAEVLAGCA